MTNPDIKCFYCAGEGMIDSSCICSHCGGTGLDPTVLPNIVERIMGATWEIRPEPVWFVHPDIQKHFDLWDEAAAKKAKADYDLAMGEAFNDEIPLP